MRIRKMFRYALGIVGLCSMLAFGETAQAAAEEPNRERDSFVNHGRRRIFAELPGVLDKTGT